MSTWDDVYAVLEEIRHLEDDWDGQGSPAPGGMVVEVARGMAAYFRKEGYCVPSRVVQSVNGSIWFQWWIGGDYFEVEIELAELLEEVETVFIVHATHPLGDGWQDREAAIEAAIGRKADRGQTADGVREIWYYCDSLGAGREMREAILKVGGVSCVVREP